MNKSKINLPTHKIANFCKENHIVKLSLFGSVLRGDFQEGSDIDFLVEFEPGKAPGLINYCRMERELSKNTRLPESRFTYSPGIEQIFSRRSISSGRGSVCSRMTIHDYDICLTPFGTPPFGLRPHKQGSG